MLGCCAGQSLGCGFAFLLSWLAAWLASSLLTPYFGVPGSTNTMVGILIALIAGLGSLLISGIFAFFTGRIFPIFQKLPREQHKSGEGRPNS